MITLNGLSVGPDSDIAEFSFNLFPRHSFVDFHRMRDYSIRRGDDAPTSGSNS
jgi:hypothetical protein